MNRHFSLCRTARQAGTSASRVWSLIGLAALLGGCGSRGPAPRPNFLWIVSEDNSKHYLELFDPNGIATPHIASMAEEGILFTRAFSNAPVCSVARSTLASSCYGPRTGTQYHRKDQPVPLPDGVRLFPAYLREAGYYATNRHKEDYNYEKGEGVWDESSRDAHWSGRAEGQPFFHMESHPVSHESRLHFDSALMRTYRPVTDPAEVHLFPQHPDTRLFRFTAAYYRDRILSVDTLVGRVLNELEEAGELERTFVFYFSDHGGVLPGSKGYAYETGLHIPLVVRVPAEFRHLVRMPDGSRSDRFVSFVDFGPTLLSLAGIDPVKGTDGVPFMGEYAPPPDESRQVTFGYADRFDEKYDLVRTARMGKYKYIRSYRPFTFDGLQNNYRYRCLAFSQWRDLFRLGELNPVQAAFFLPRQPEALYDLEADPYETINLADDPAYGKIRGEMRALLTGWVKSMPDLSFFPEHVMLEQSGGNPVAFGRNQKDRISRLVDIADLSLQPYGEAREGIRQALYSEDPHQVRWGLIACSCFGAEASGFYGRAGELCSHPDLLVRTRAAEFLALAGVADPAPVIRGALYGSRNGLETLQILNSLVMLRDGPAASPVEFDPGSLSPRVRGHSQVQRRLEYLTGE